MTQTKKTDGGSAFPSNQSVTKGMYSTGKADGGMSLRDWFAGQALSSIGGDEMGCDPKQTARWMYAVADAMIEERERGR